VRNESDGSVQIMVGGPIPLVSRFLDELNVGPPNAVIQSINEIAIDVNRQQEGHEASLPVTPTLPYPFEIRR
jgi:acylphosphatase